MFLSFLSTPILKSGFLTLKWNLVLDFRILKWYFPHKFRAISAISAVSTLFPRFPWFPYHLRIMKSSTKFHLKVKVNHFLKRGLEWNGKNKNVLKFDAAKDWWIIFWKNIFVKKDYPFNIRETILLMWMETLCLMCLHR